MKSTELAGGHRGQHLGNGDKEIKSWLKIAVSLIVCFETCFLFTI